MASKYSDPRDFVFYIKKGAKIGIVTADVSDSDNAYESIDEALTDGILYEYNGDRTLLDASAATIEAETVPMNARVHGSLIDWILYRLYLEKPGATRDDINMSKAHYNLFNKNAHRLEGGDPQTENRVVVPLGVTALK